MTTLQWVGAVAAADDCDCDPSDPTVFQPPEVTPVSLARREPTSALLLWDEVQGADSYSITRGLLSQISPGQYGSCLIQGVTVTRYNDGDDPGSGEGYSYLVRAERGTCGSGPLGFTSTGAARVNLDPQACP